MWSYLCYILYSYLLLYDSQASLVTPLQTTLSPENPRSLWEDIKEVTHDLIETSHQDGGPKTLFQPTSFLNPGYGVLFQHIGKLHQSVYKHYLIISMKIPTLQHMPEQPEEWYQGCEDGVPLLRKTYEDFTFKHIFHDDYCAEARFKHLYTDITQILHSTIPALLPNQVVPYAVYRFFNLTPEELPTNAYATGDTHQNKQDADFTILEDLLIEDIQHALDYNFKYGEPLPLDADTIYAEEVPKNSSTVVIQKKHFLGTLIRGIGCLFRGANTFGKLFSGIKKVGGFIFKGIKGLFHRCKNTALVQAVKAFASWSKKLILDKLYKFHKIRGLHTGKSSFTTILRHT